MPDLYFLIEFPIFRDLEADDIDALAGLSEELPLPAGSAVVREGEPADAMYVVKSGVLDVCRKVGADLKHINLLSAGEFFGEMALIDGSPRSADVLVKEDAVLIKLSSEAFKKLRKEKPATALKIADVLLKTLSFRVRRSTTRALASETAPASASPPPLPLRSAPEVKSSPGRMERGTGGEVKPRKKKRRPAPRKKSKPKRKAKKSK